MNKRPKTPSDNDPRIERPDLALDHLYRFAGTIGTTGEIDVLLEDALDPLLAMAEAQKVIVALAEREKAPLRVTHQRGWKTVPEGDIALEAVTTLRPDALGYINGAELPKPFRKLTGEAAAHPVALIPLWARAQLQGLLILVRDGGAPFDSTTLKLIGTACRQLALAIESSKLFTDLQHSYHQLIDMQEGLIRSESLAALGGLAASMAHEIRNPLSTIFSAISQVRKHAQVMGDSATLLEIAEEEVVRLNKMVAGLLEFARPRTPKVCETRPADIANEVIRGLPDKNEAAGDVEIVLKPGSEELVAVFDPELFERTLHHLTLNALAAVAPKDGRIEIAIEGHKDNKRGMLVSVSDNGCGIPAEVRNNVFEPFFSTKASGVGLGLPVVKRIVEDHGGFVEIDSKPGRGTTVRMLFNRSEDRATDGAGRSDGGKHESNKK